MGVGVGVKGEAFEEGTAALAERWAPVGESFAPFKSVHRTRRDRQRGALSAWRALPLNCDQVRGSTFLLEFSINMTLSTRGGHGP